MLWDGDTDAAWAAAPRGGCDAPIWLRLATARAVTHPAEAIPILTRVIDTARAKIRHQGLRRRRRPARPTAQLAPPGRNRHRVRRLPPADPRQPPRPTRFPGWTGQGATPL